MQTCIPEYFKLTKNSLKSYNNDLKNKIRQNPIKKLGKKKNNDDLFKSIKYGINDIGNACNTNLSLTINKSIACSSKIYNNKTFNAAIESPDTVVIDIDVDETIIYDFDETSVNKSQDLKDEIEEDTFLELTINEESIYFWSVKNFLKIMKFVNSKHNFKKILPKIDIDNLTTFASLKEEYQHFLLKLFVYLPKWYNIYKFAETIKLNLDRAEIDRMYTELIDKGCVIAINYTNEEPINLLDQLNLNNIKALYKSFKLPTKKKLNKKSDLINSIIQHCNKQPTITPTKTLKDILKARIEKLMGRFIKLNISMFKTFYRMHVLYTIGTNLIKPSDLYLFMSQMDKGEIILPTITTQDVEIFENEDAFIKYTDAHEFCTEFQNAFEKKNKKIMETIAERAYKKLREYVIMRNDNVDLPPLRKRLSAEHLYSKILYLASEHLTTTCDALIIIDWLKILIEIDCHKKTGFCYKQLSLICTKYLKLNNEAAKYILTGLTNPNLSPIDLSMLKDRANSLCKAKTNKIEEELKTALESVEVYQPNINNIKKKVITAQAIIGESAGLKKVYMLRGNDLTTYTSVEEVALRHYKNDGYPLGVHCEGSLIMTLFCILFWDIIYNENISNVFITELQYLPFDLYTSDFYKNREYLIKQRLEDIRCVWKIETIKLFIEDIWESHSYKRSLITMSMLDTETIITIFFCIGRSHLAKIFERLISNINYFSAGMPDLFMWNKDKMECKFVEVKGEGDKLSMKQKFWLDYLNSIEVNAEICLVKTLGSRRNHNI